MKAANSAADAWVRLNPTKIIAIYDVSWLIRRALPTAASPRNIQSEFRSAGIWPFNPDVFQEYSFSPSQMTDHPDLTSMACAASQQDSFAATAASTLSHMSSAASSSAPAETSTKTVSPSTV